MDYATLATAIFSGLIVFSALGYQLYDLARQTRLSTDRIARAESRVQSDTQLVKPAWDLARVTLESYLNRNLSQINAIYYLSLIVSSVGFVVIIWGVSSAIGDPNNIAPAVVAAVAGVITEFVGASFLIVYRATVDQSTRNSEMLERINSVGMAMQILDTMPERIEDGDLKNKTKATLVELLVKETHGLQSRSDR